MKNILFLILIVFCLKGNGQDVEFNKMNIGLFFSPNYSYRKLKDSKETDIRNGLEESILGYSTGFSISPKINNLFGIESGIQYMHRGFRTKEMRVASGANYNQLKLIYHFNYIGIPLKVYFRKQISTSILTTKSGLIGNFLIIKDLVTIMEYNEYTETKHTNIAGDFSSMILTFVISVELGSKIYDNFYFEIGPTFYYDLSSIINDPIKTYLWDLGLNFNIYYNF